MTAAPITLIGFMGAGKSVAGRLLARKLGRFFLDLDELVTLRTGLTPAECIRSRGEDDFRRAEGLALAQALSTQNTVIATGGGCVLREENRSLLRAAAGPVVWLEVSPAEALRRTTPSASPVSTVSAASAASAPAQPSRERPLLPTSEEGAGRLLAERTPAYTAAATTRVDTTGLGPEEVAGEVASRLPSHSAASTALTARLEAIKGPGRHGPVLIGRGLLDPGGPSPWSFLAAGDPNAAPAAGDPVPARRALFVSEPLAYALHGRPVLETARRAGLSVTLHLLPSGEEAKTPSVLAALWEAAARAGLRRTDLVMSLGGGAVSDTAGLAAATYMRGLDVIHFPTTLLAQVDAALGGKAAVNLPQGKNLAGSFHFPAAVVADIGTLRTLPPVLVAEGLAELAKTLLVGGADPARLREALEPSRPDEDLAADLPHLVTQAARAKLALVGTDPTDTGPRLALNLGHTFGHALEALSGYGVSHGLAVTAGLWAATHLSEASGHLDSGRARTIRGLVETLLGRFPVLHLRHLAALDARAAGRHLPLDKKADRYGLRFVLLEGGTGRGVRPVVAGPGRPGSGAGGQVDPEPKVVAALTGALELAGKVARSIQGGDRQ